MEERYFSAKYMPLMLSRCGIGHPLVYALPLFLGDLVWPIKGLWDYLCRLIKHWGPFIRIESFGVECFWQEVVAFGP